MGNFHVISSKEKDGLRTKSILSGMLITDNSIVIGQSGWNAFEREVGLDKSELLNARDGRYFVVKSYGDELVSRVDGSGSDPIFLYRHREDWAFSNSLFELVKYCKKLNWPLTLDYSVLASMFVSGSMGRQLLSSQTPVSQITLIPSDRYLSCDLSKNTVYEKRIFRNPTVNSFYEETLIEWFLKWRSVLFSLAIHSDEKLSFDLSGGIDSRMLFGLASSSSAKDKFEFFSQPHKHKDLAIARSLCDRFSCRLSTTPPKWNSMPVEFQYDSYCKGNLGFYNLPVTPPLGRSVSKCFKINGIGGENLRNFYSGSGEDWVTKVRGLLPNYLSGYGDEVSNLLFRAYNEFEIDPKDKDGMMIHYRKLRSRIIGGRNSYEGLKFNMVTPLTDPLLVDLNDLSGKKNGLEIYRDIMVAGGGEELVSHPYDEDSKSFDLDFIRKSPFFNRPDLSSWGHEKEYAVYFDSDEEPQASFDGDLVSNEKNLRGRISEELTFLSEFVASGLVPEAFVKLYSSGEWSSSEGRKKDIEAITWHAFLKLHSAVYG